MVSRTSQIEKKKCYDSCMSLKQYVLGLLILIAFASGLIFYKLGNVPHGMTWDEAAIGYNGYAVITTRRDEWLKRLPVSFQSFGDYKAPLGIYLNGAFTTVLGMELWVVRLPFALAGIMTVAGVAVLVVTLLTSFESKKEARSWGLVAGALTLTSPWFLHFARVGFEAGLSLCLLVWGCVSLSWLFQLKPGWNSSLKSKFDKAMTLLITSGLLAGSIYSYHSAKVVVPVVTGFLILYFAFPRLKQWWREVIALGILSLIWLRPLLMDIANGSGAERFHQATLFNKGLTAVELFQTLSLNTVSHLDPRFIVGGLTPTLRHGDGTWGILLWPVGLLVLSGVVALIAGWSKRKILSLEISEFRLAIFGLAWTLMGFLPAILGVDVPHANRSLLALPGIMILAVVGARWLIKMGQQLSLNHQVRGTHGETDLLPKALTGIFVLITSLLFIAYQHDYYTVFAHASADEFRDGYLEAFEYVIPYEKGEAGKPEVEKIVFTNDYGQPYIYALFVRRTNPIWYQGGSLIKYEFKDTINIGDLERKNAVIVASETDDIPVDQADAIIYGSDGKIRFKIYVR